MSEINSSEVITRVELLKLLEILESYGNERLPFKFAYAIAKNIKIIQDEKDTLDKGFKAEDKFIEYDKKRVDLCLQFAKRDDKNNPVIQDNQFIMEDQAGFVEMWSQLREEYQDAIIYRDKQFQDYQKMLEETISVSFHKIKKEDFPETIRPNDLTSMMCLMIE